MTRLYNKDFPNSFLFSRKKMKLKIRKVKERKEKVKQSGGRDNLLNRA